MEFNQFYNEFDNQFHTLLNNINNKQNIKFERYIILKNIINLLLNNEIHIERNQHLYNLYIYKLYQLFYEIDTILIIDKENLTISSYNLLNEIKELLLNNITI